MDSQRKIFAYLLVFISTGLFSSILVDANFNDEKCECLAKYYVQYFETLKSMCSPNHPWPEDNPIQEYQKALEAEHEPISSPPFLPEKKVKVITSLIQFKATTEQYFDKIDNILKDRIKFGELPNTKTEAIINLCKKVREECIPEEPTVELPLAGDLERLFGESNKYAVANKKENELEFAQHCKPKIPDALKDGECLAKCFVGYFKNLKSWCSPNHPWPEDNYSIQNYENLIQFEATTKKYFDEIDNILKDRIKFGELPNIKTEAIFNLCIGIKECIPGEPTVEIPLAGDLERLFGESNKYEKKRKNRVHNESKFVKHCRPASASHQPASESHHLFKKLEDLLRN